MQIFEIKKDYQNEHEFDSIYSRSNLPKIKDGTYVINLAEYKSIGTHQIALFVNDDNRSAPQDATYFDSFRVEHIPKELKN